MVSLLHVLIVMGIALRYYRCDAANVIKQVVGNYTIGLPGYGPDMSAVAIAIDSAGMSLSTNLLLLYLLYSYVTLATCC